MAKNLVIVESPAKGKTIEKFLGKDYRVEASFGHIRDLPKKNMGVDIAAGFLPEYEISPDKKKRVAELKKLAKAAEKVWIATDEDREGEAIGWHLCQALGLDDQAVDRIVFHEITKTAIEKAIEHPRKIFIDLVNAQQSRRILDRIVGYEVSPVLWKKVQPGLSAGRVQSVAVKLLVEREREIRAFVPEESWKISANLAHKIPFSIELTKIDGKKIGVAQVNTVNEEEVLKREAKLVEEIKKISSEKGLEFFMFVITNILTNDSVAIVTGNGNDYIEKAFNSKVENGLVTLKGVVSRKKQIIPPLTKAIQS